MTIHLKKIMRVVRSRVMRLLLEVSVVMILKIQWRRSMVVTVLVVVVVVFLGSQFQELLVKTDMVLSEWLC